MPPLLIHLSSDTQHCASDSVHACFGVWARATRLPNMGKLGSVLHYFTAHMTTFLSPTLSYAINLLAEKAS